MQIQMTLINISIIQTKKSQRTVIMTKLSQINVFKKTSNSSSSAQIVWTTEEENVAGLLASAR